MKHEVVETARWFDTSHLPDRDGDHGADIVEYRLFPDCTKRGDSEIRAVQRLEQEGTRPRFDIFLVFAE